MHCARITQPRTTVRTIARVCVVRVVRRERGGLRLSEHELCPCFAVVTKPIDGRLDVRLESSALVIALHQLGLSLSPLRIGCVEKIGAAVAIAGRPCLRRRWAVMERRI